MRQRSLRSTGERCTIPICAWISVQRPSPHFATPSRSSSSSSSVQRRRFRLLCAAMRSCTAEDEIGAFFLHYTEKREANMPCSASMTRARVLRSDGGSAF